MVGEIGNLFVISIMSRDRVGIIYEVAGALGALEGDIADLRQSVLSGYFTMILLASFPPTVTKRAIERKLAELDANSETVIEAAITQVHDAAPAPGALPEHSYVLTASGPDRIGFVATVAGFCVEHGINILDLSTTVHEGTYIMILIIDLSNCGSMQQVRTDLARFAQEKGLNMVLQHHDIFRATNEVM